MGKVRYHVIWQLTWFGISQYITKLICNVLLVSTTFGLVWSAGNVWQAANLMWDDMQCSIGQRCWSWWVPLRVRQRMTEREPPLSSHRPYIHFSQSFHYFPLVLTEADEMLFLQLIKSVVIFIHPQPS